MIEDAVSGFDRVRHLEDNPVMARTPDEKKRDAVLCCAKRLFGKHGIANTNLDNIALVAGVSRTTLYNQFADKDGIIAAVIEREWKKLLVEIDRQSLVFFRSSDSIGKEAVADFICALALKAMSDAALVRIFTEASVCIPDPSGKAKKLADLLEEKGKGVLAIPNDQEVRIKILAIALGMLNAAAFCHAGKSEYDLHDVINALKTMILR